MPGSATARKPNRKGARKPLASRRRVRFVEFVQASDTHQIDFEKGCIYHVKVLGFDSVNNRRYTEDAVRNAIPLYEGTRVNIDHPGVSGRGKGLQPTDPRSAYDRFGKLVKVQFEAGAGLFADLWFLKRHAMARNVCEAAERMPDLFGLSHNAEGEGHDEDGTFIVEEIKDVRHVDLVADAATNKTLFEGRQSTGRESAMVKIPKAQHKLFRKWLAESKREKLKRVLKALGEGYEDDDTGTKPDGSGDSGGSYKSHLQNAVGAVVGDDGLSPDQKKDKLRKFVDMMCEDDEIEDDETEDDETEDDETEDDETEADVSAANVEDDDTEDDETEDDETEDEDTQEANYGDEDDIATDSGDKDTRGMNDKGKKGVVTGAFGGSGLKTGIESRKFKKSKDPAVRQLQEEIYRSRLRDWIRARCAKRKVPCTESVLKALYALRKPKAIAEHIEFLRNNLKTESRLRSQGPTVALEEQAAGGGGARRQRKIPAGGRKLADWLLN